MTGTRRWVLGAGLFLVLVALMGLGQGAVQAKEEAAPAPAVTPWAFIITDWRFFDDNGNGGQGAFVTGPGTPPLGQGSAMLQVTNASQGYAFGTAVNHPHPLRLDRIKVLRYSTYRASPDPSNVLAITFQFFVDFDVTDAITSYQGRFVFEPYTTQTSVPSNTWQTWDLLTQEGWWHTGGILCTQSNPCTWTDILNTYPNAGIHPGYPFILFKAGSGWNVPFTGYVDKFEIAIDAVGNLFTFDFDPPPTVGQVFVGSSPVANGQVLDRSSDKIRIVFQHDAPMYRPSQWGYAGHADEVTNPANYKLVHTTLGTIPINNVTYFEDTTTNTYYVTLDVNNGVPLPNGSYALTVSGTTSVVDVNGIPLAGNGTTSGTDFVLEFSIDVQPEALPETGFPPTGRALPARPRPGVYQQTAMELRIPRLGVRAPIVGIPQTNGTWDVGWLYNQVGWLEGSAFPTWRGNTVLTAHAWNYDGTPGLFARVPELRYGDRVLIRAWGLEYVYEVREFVLARPENLKGVFTHKERDWVTLLTCVGFDPETGTYRFRYGVRAVLVGIRPAASGGR